MIEISASVFSGEDPGNNPEAGLISAVSEASTVLPLNNLINKTGALLNWPGSKRLGLNALLNKRADQMKEELKGSELASFPPEDERILTSIENIASENAVVSAGGLFNLMDEMKLRLNWPEKKFREISAEAAWKLYTNRVFDFRRLGSALQLDIAKSVRRVPAWLANASREYWDTLEKQIPGISKKYNDRMTGLSQTMSKIVNQVRRKRGKKFSLKKLPQAV